MSDQDSGAPPPQRDEPVDTAEVRRRQRGRANVMGLGLAALAVLFFAITIAKMGLAQ